MMQNRAVLPGAQKDQTGKKKLCIHISTITEPADINEQYGLAVFESFFHWYIYLQMEIAVKVYIYILVYI